MAPQIPPLPGRKRERRLGVLTFTLDVECPNPNIIPKNELSIYYCIVYTKHGLD
jgi:hypothetical protein